MSKQTPRLSIIAALSKRDRGIGKNGTLLWKIPEDLAHFKQLTSGHVVVMGRKTYESIGRPLPNRTNIIITRNMHYHAPGCILSGNLTDALKKAATLETSEIFIMGGGEIYAQSLHLVDTLHLTIVEGEFDADIFFPEFSSCFKLKRSIPSMSSHGIKLEFQEWSRTAPCAST